jgi:hypothetical protein
MYSTKPQLTTLLRGMGLGLLLCTGLAVSHAATSAGQFSVNITVTGTDTGSGTSSGINTAAQSAPGVCISQTLSEKTNALVRVVCGTGQFVSITANPNARFLGANGGAFRFVLSPGSTDSGSQLLGQGRTNDFYPGAGTVTAWRIYNVNGSDGTFEVLLTF